MTEKIDFIHMLAHLFGWNTGMVVSKRDEDGNLWMGFKCDKCGVVSLRERTCDMHCPTCGYYCVGKGGHGCIHKQDMQ